MILVLELARGLAALWVFFFHAQDLFGDRYPWLVAAAAHGHLGVPMFFVISGYVIFHSASRNRAEGTAPEVFLKNRLRRIYPAFWCSIAVVMAVPFLLAWVSSVKSGHLEPVILPGASYSFADWVHFVSLSKVFFAPNGDLSGQFTAINAVYWTLAIEVQFYLVMYLCLRLGRFFGVGVWAVTALAVVDALLGQFGNAGWFYHFWLSFAAGLVLGWLFKFAPNGAGLPSGIPAGLRLAVGLMFSLLLCAAAVQFGMVAFSFAFAVLLWFAAGIEPLLVRQRQTDASPLFKWLLRGGLALGAMSYSVYLLHGKLYLLSGMFVRQVVPISTVAYGFGTIVLTLLMCWPFYLLVERKFMSRAHQSRLG